MNNGSSSDIPVVMILSSNPTNLRASPIQNRVPNTFTNERLKGVRVNLRKVKRGQSQLKCMTDKLEDGIA